MPAPKTSERRRRTNSAASAASCSATKRSSAGSTSRKVTATSQHAKRHSRHHTPHQPVGLGRVNSRPPRRGVPMTAPVTETDSTTGSDRRGFGIDVGGSGVKGGIVDLDTGVLIGARYKLPPPQPATPEALAKTIAAVVKEFGWTKPLGVTYPGVVAHGVVRTAANRSEER